jgi:hypothetical protein
MALLIVRRRGSVFIFDILFLPHFSEKRATLKLTPLTTNQQGDVFLLIVLSTRSAASGKKYH